MKKDWHWYLGFRVDLALVLAQVPQLRVADLQGPGVGLGAVQAAEPVVPCSEVGQGASLVTGEQWCTCEGDDAAGEHVQRGLLYPGHLHNDPHHYIVLYCTVLYCTTLHCTVPYCTVLYWCTVQETCTMVLISGTIVWSQHRAHAICMEAGAEYSHHNPRH